VNRNGGDDDNDDNGGIILPKFIIRPQNTTTKLNDNLIKFDCIVNARPLDQIEIEWYKNEQLIDFKTSKYRLYQQSRSIEIISINDQDAGLYTCSIQFKYNDNTIKLNASAYLDVYYKPTFKIQPPSIIEADIGGTKPVTTFKCDGISNPKAAITWFKDARPISASTNSASQTDGTIINDDGRQLQISNITLNSSGIYQCFIQNSIGEISASSLLSIISKPPVFVLKPSDVTTFSGFTVQVECKVNGSPTPRVEWHRILMTPPTATAVLVSATSMLTIDTISTKMSGTYKCKATNELGTIDHTITIDVRRKTEITDAPPATINVIKGQTTKLNCMCDHDPYVHVQLKWKFNEQPIDFGLGRNLMLLDNGTLVIAETTNENIGLYRCDVSSMGGNDTRTAYLNVVELPYPPVNLNVRIHDERNETRRVNLTWQTSFDGNSPIIRFKVCAYVSNLKYSKVNLSISNDYMKLIWVYTLCVDDQDSFESIKPGICRTTHGYSSQCNRVRQLLLLAFF
jgi:hypothetical protein